MADTPGRTGRGPTSGHEPAIIRAPLMPPRRMSLGEEEAFPITAADIQAPRLPPEVPEQRVATQTQDAPVRKRRYNVTAIVFVVVAAVGTLAAVRLYFAASHDAPGIQE
jgi:hypothetical protein